jgi:tetratricopeptide (TPR) repeat protein
LAKTVAGEARKHRPTGSKSAPRNGEALTDQAVVALPEVPDPLLFATTPMLGASKAVAMRKSAPGSVPLAPDPRFAKPSTRPTKNLALATPYLAEPVALPPSLPSAPAAGQTERAGLEPVPLAAASVAVPTVQPKAELPKTEPSDSVLFGRALRTLRSESDPTAALALLEEHARAYPRSALAGERRVLEVEALLALHRDREALQRLDGMPLDQLPRSGERFVVRGELRAAARRWQEAQADFDRALSRVSGSPAWHERALWGRGVSRLRCGEQEAGLADVERYHDLYPKGRFAAEAGRFFRNQ